MMLNYWERLIGWLTTHPQRSELLRPWRGWLFVIPTAYGIAVTISVLCGVPSRLPGVALGMPALLAAERGIALLAVVAAVLIFAFMTSRGDLPSGFGNVTYRPRSDREHEVEVRVAELGESVDERLISLERSQGATGDALPILAHELLDLRGRLDALERRQGD